MIKSKVGDKVAVECLTSMGQDSEETITKITTKYDENTGKPYKVIWCGERAFYSTHGGAFNPPMFYCISDL